MNFIFGFVKGPTVVLPLTRLAVVDIVIGAQCAPQDGGEDALSSPQAQEGGLLRAIWRARYVCAMDSVRCGIGSLRSKVQLQKLLVAKQRTKTSHLSQLGGVSAGRRQWEWSP